MNLLTVRAGSASRQCVRESSPTSWWKPPKTFGGNVAFIIGSGDQRRIAMASLRDGRVLRRFSRRSDNGMAASPDGRTLYYSFSGGIWAQPVEGGEPKLIVDGVDVTLDPPRPIPVCEA
jgi:sugar lactone lactonase YvrE